MDVHEISSLIIKEGVKLGADEVAAIVVRDLMKQVRFANNEVTVINILDEMSANILLKKDKKVLIASITDVSDEGIKRCLNDLVKMAKVIRAHESYAPLPRGPFEYEDVPRIYDGRVPRLNDKCVDYVEAAMNSASKEGPVRAAGTLSTTESVLSLTTSSDISAELKKTKVELLIRCLANGESSGVGISCGSNLDDFDPEGAGEEAGRLARMSMNPVGGKAGSYDVVLGRPAAAVFFDVVAGASSAFLVDSGLSCLADRIEQEVGSKALTIYDDPKMEGGLGSRPFDDEGYPTRKTTIIKDGILKTYLHNSFTAKRHKTTSTSNAGWIVPRPWNVVVRAGELSDEDLVADVNDGLYVNNLTYVRFQDYRAGDFSGIIRDGVFRIKNGEVAEPIKGLRLSDNVLRMLKNLRACSKEQAQIRHWWMEWGSPVVKTPLVAIDDVRFTIAVK